MPTTMFNRIFPDRRDPNRGKWDYLCRYCGKSTEHTRRRYYCSDECYWNCQRAVAWWHARRGTFNRDKGLCVDCRRKLDYDETWDCHHVIPVIDLNTLAYELTWKHPEWVDLPEWKKRRGFAIIYTLLVHDINNLVTLCSECHKKRHASKPKTPTIPVNIITLEQFFGEQTSMRTGASTSKGSERYEKMHKL